MAILKQRVHRMNESGSYDIIHYETSSDLVIRPDGSSVENSLINIANNNNILTRNALEVINKYDIVDYNNNSVYKTIEKTVKGTTLNINTTSNAYCLTMTDQYFFRFYFYDATQLNVDIIDRSTHDTIRTVICSGLPYTMSTSSIQVAKMTDSLYAISSYNNTINLLFAEFTNDYTSLVIKANTTPYTERTEHILLPVNSTHVLVLSGCYYSSKSSYNYAWCGYYTFTGNSTSLETFTTSSGSGNEPSCILYADENKCIYISEGGNSEAGQIIYLTFSGDNISGTNNVLAYGGSSMGVTPYCFYNNNEFALIAIAVGSNSAKIYRVDFANNSHTETGLTITNSTAYNSYNLVGHINGYIAHSMYIECIHKNSSLIFTGYNINDFTYVGKIEVSSIFSTLTRGTYIKDSDKIYILYNSNMLYELTYDKELTNLLSNYNEADYWYTEINKSSMGIALNDANINDSVDILISGKTNISDNVNIISNLFRCFTNNNSLIVSNNIEYNNYSYSTDPNIYFNNRPIFILAIYGNKVPYIQIGDITYRLDSYSFISNALAKNGDLYVFTPPSFTTSSNVSYIAIY